MKTIYLLIVLVLVMQNVAQAGILDFFKRLLQMDDSIDLTSWDSSDMYNDNLGGPANITLPICEIQASDNFLEVDVPQENLDSLTRDNNMFAVNFYHAINDTMSNILIAPITESLAGGLAYAGAMGDTKDQIAKAFSYELTSDDLHNAFRHYFKNYTWNVMDGLNLVNSIWAQEGIVFTDDYKRIVNDDYHTCVRQVDFVNRAEDIRLAVNEYFSNESAGKIDELIPEGVITADTNLLLVNLFYFVQDWDKAFDAMMTDQLDFNLQDGTTVKTSMMHQSSSYPYYEGDGYKAIKLDYRDKLYSLSLILPDADKFADIANGIDNDFINNIWDNLEDSDIRLSLPKFSIKGRFSQRGLLNLLGMNDAFDKDLADFSGMDGAKDLWLRDLINGCYFEVRESGVNMVEASDVEDAVDLSFDRSFLFLLHDNARTIFYIGQFTAPLVPEVVPSASEGTSEEATNETPAEAAPAEGAPAEGAPAEAAPAEGAPADVTPTEQAPSDMPPSEETPSEGGQ